MSSSQSTTLKVRIERWPITGSFTISRGAKTEAVTVVAEVSRGGRTGRGECAPYPRYGETPEATLAALARRNQLWLVMGCFDKAVAAQSGPSSGRGTGAGALRL